MTRDDIERMAKEAGAMEWGESVVPAMMDIEKFAALVAAAEREACAKVCEEDGLLWGQRYAAAIRARGEQKQP